MTGHDKVKLHLSLNKMIGKLHAPRAWYTVQHVVHTSKSLHCNSLQQGYLTWDTGAKGPDWLKVISCK